ncbi:MAG: hypothetical protein U0Q22_19735 [Acidimicrobiales bacterium]
MNILSTRLSTRLAVTLVAGAALVLGACGDDGSDGTTDDGHDAPATTVIDAGDAGDAAGGIEPAQACGLLDLAAVDALLGTSGVAAHVDTSLGLLDGCRWATAPTDAAALIVAHDPTMSFADVRDRSCEGETPQPAPTAHPEAVSCYGTVIAPAGTGVVLVSIEDGTYQWDDATRLDLAVRAAADVLG